MPDLSRIGERERLKSRAGDEPHWQRLSSGSYVGFRPAKRGGKGTWFARALDREREKYQRRALGCYPALSGHDIFTQARKDAQAWADTVESGGVPDEKIETVADACRSYLKSKPGSIAEGVFRRHVFSDPVAKIKLRKLRRHHLREWRKRLEDTPALITRGKRGEKQTRPRALATVNRDMVPFGAALRAILAPGAPGTDAAWQEAIKPHRGVGKRRTLYIDKGERQRLVAAADARIGPFLRALCFMPLRPGALAALVVGDYDGRTRSLTIGKDKNGMPRQITVPQIVSDFLTAQCAQKSKDAFLFTREDGKLWKKDDWKGPIKEAAAAANLSPELSAYTLRHSVITDLVRDGLPILTVAQLSGTSVAMIEKHYGHLVRDDAEQALAGLAF